MLRSKYAKLLLVQAPILLLLLIIVACGNDAKTSGLATQAASISATAPTIRSMIVSTDLAVGANRLVVGLIDGENNVSVTNAPLNFRLFKLIDRGHEEILKAEMVPQPIAFQKNFIHTHDDGYVETHETGEIGVYVADVEFDSPGEWGVEINGSINGQPIETIRRGFIVNEQSSSVGMGELAPHTIQTTLSDVDDIFEIDTSNPPTPYMHDMTIADAVSSGFPTVIVFSTPGFCRTQLCGPTKDIIDQLYETYKGQANFVHVEPYDLEKARNGQALLIKSFLVEDWGLKSEPWVFLVDGQGKIAAKYESFVSLDELGSEMNHLTASVKTN